MTCRVQYELVMESTGPFFHKIRRSLSPPRSDNVPKYVVVVIIVIIIEKTGEVEEEVGWFDVVTKVHRRSIAADRGKGSERHDGRNVFFVTKRGQKGGYLVDPEGDVLHIISTSNKE
jgi:hypothetical protein